MWGVHIKTESNFKPPSQTLPFYAHLQVLELLRNLGFQVVQEYS